ncbi:MFS transporter [Piscinibacter gummiphilus]|uniref:MFS transporter n=1 Tax=Piscinibacter gummiphilus TaxID=946333 RepID=A0A1W6LI36_9BURK|nr:MFS transporter [Piscinibacter gummiphilus]ARN23857.1 MFS transporter [Piscinibacter gummiphilus]ATU68537.1 MFS transporter [Piscinibacter gummiphilus]GLS98314.1 MFS transporter [Piscinibacter gummiphilus]
MNPVLYAWGVRALFFAAGLLFATWGVHVPTVKGHYGLGEQALAVAMLAGGVGAVGGLTQAGRLIGRFGPRKVALVSGCLCAASIGLLLAFHTMAVLLLVMVAFGLANSLFDVSVNVAASDLEARAGRPLMSGFHGMFSLGGMAGAAGGAALLSAGVEPWHHLAAATAVGVTLVAFGCWTMPRAKKPEEGAGGHAFLLPRGTLLLIGILAALGLIAEGAMYDWSVLYVKQELLADAGTAALGYAAFSGAMAAARFGGDWVRARLSSALLVRLSGLLAAAGMTLSLVTSSPVVALLGFALVGLGFANIVPVLFSAAATVPGVKPADGIAAVASLGYFGMMVGPPLIGFVAEHQSLTVGLATVVLAAVMLSAAARSALARPA